MTTPQALINQLATSILEAWPAPVDPVDAIATERKLIAGYLQRAGFGASVTTAGVSLPDLIRSGRYAAASSPVVFAACGIDMVSIPAGKFLMGSPSDEPDRCDNEGPQHEVTLKAFFLSRTPITQAQWRAVAGWVERPGERWGLDLSGKLKPSSFRGDNRPVENVNWFEAMEFCSRLSQRSGKTYTLPSEAQWEYACRAGTTTPFTFGETLTKEQVNFDGNGTMPVSSFPANAWGLHDMHGNVWEWCLDDWHGHYEGAPTDGSAWMEGNDSLGKRCAVARGSTSPGAAARLTATGSTRTAAISTLVSASVAPDSPKLLRGGSWYNLPRGCRSAFRLRDLPGLRDRLVGFRVCCLPQD